MRVCLKGFLDPAAADVPAAGMSYLDGVPFRAARSLEGAALGQGGLVSAPAIDVPDCAELLVSTMHDFSLERKVLYWLEAASLQHTGGRGAASAVPPSAPPCWLLLVEPRDGDKEAAGRGKAGGAVRRSVSLSAAADSEAWLSEEDEASEDDEASSTSCEENGEEERAARRPAWPPQGRPKTSPGLLQPAPVSGCRGAAGPQPARHRRSMLIFNNMRNELEGARRKLAALVHPLNRACADKKPASALASLRQPLHNKRNFRCGSDAPGPLAPAPPERVPHAPPAAMPPITQHKPTVASLSPYACLPPASAPARPLGCRRAQPDSAANLLAALSQEERDLIEPVIALGYPAHKAILTLQKTGKQSLSQFLGYLRACDRLLKQGYEEGQVEEAMEMFQYSEKKAAEFLHLLAQFNDMGFQQNEIKEVLLLCENHREKALEELMTQRQ